MTTRRVKGQLIHEDAIQKSLYGLGVELWDRDPLVDDHLGSATTDRYGRFDIEYNPADAGRLERGLPDFELRVFDRPGENMDAGAKARLLVKIHGPDNVDAPRFNFGRVRVPHWEYDHSYPSGVSGASQRGCFARVGGTSSAGDAWRRELSIPCQNPGEIRQHVVSRALSGQEEQRRVFCIPYA